MLIEPLAGNGEAGFVLFQKCGSYSIGYGVPQRTSHVLPFIGNLGPYGSFHGFPSLSS
jgi:hypothetical protein